MRRLTPHRAAQRISELNRFLYFLISGVSVKIISINDLNEQKRNTYDYQLSVFKFSCCTLIDQNIFYDNTNLLRGHVMLE